MSSQLVFQHAHLRACGTAVLCKRQLGFLLLTAKAYKWCSVLLRKNTLSFWFIQKLKCKNSLKFQNLKVLKGIKNDGRQTTEKKTAMLIVRIHGVLFRIYINSSQKRKSKELSPFCINCTPAIVKHIPPFLDYFLFSSSLVKHKLW